MLNAPTEVTPTVETVPATPAEPVPAPVETPAVEAPAVETPKPEDDPKFASKFAALTRREQGVRQKEQEIKTKEAEYKAYQADQKLMNDNILAWLEKKGYGFDKLTQLALNDGKKPAEMQVQELREQLEREKQEREEAEKTRAQKSYEEQKTNFVAEISDFISANAEAYELTSVAEEPAELIYNVIEQHYKKTQRVLPIKDAVELVEKHFETEMDTKYSKLKKIQAKFAPKEPVVEPKTPVAQPRSQTITNSQAAAVATPHTKQVMSIEESKANAAKLLKWV